MYSPNKNKIIGKLRSGYTPIEITPKKELASTFKNIFKPLIKRKDLDFFFELYNMDDINLKAWSFLGIYFIFMTELYHSKLFQTHTIHGHFLSKGLFY